MDFLKSDSFFLGLILGLCIPVMAYGVLLTAFDFLETHVFPVTFDYSPTFRTRTLGLIAICVNLVPFHVYRKLGHDETMRGLVLPTIGFVVLWVYMFAGLLFRS